MEELSLNFSFLLGLSFALFAIGCGVFPFYFRLPLLLVLSILFLPSIFDLEQLAVSENALGNSLKTSKIDLVPNALLLKSLFKGVFLGFILSIAAYITVTFSCWLSSLFFKNSIKTSEILSIEVSEINGFSAYNNFHILLVLLFSYVLLSSDFVFFLFENTFFLFQENTLVSKDYTIGLDLAAFIFKFSLVLFLPFLLLSFTWEAVVSVFERYLPKSFEVDFYKALKISILLFSFLILLPAVINAFSYILQEFSSRDFIKSIFGDL